MLDRDTGSVEPGSRPYFGSVSGLENQFVVLSAVSVSPSLVLPNRTTASKWGLIYISGGLSLHHLINFGLGDAHLQVYIKISASPSDASPLSCSHLIIGGQVYASVRLGIGSKIHCLKQQILPWFSNLSNLYLARARRATYAVSSTTLQIMV